MINTPMLDLLKYVGQFLYQWWRILNVHIYVFDVKVFVAMKENRSNKNMNIEMTKRNFC